MKGLKTTIFSLLFSCSLVAQDYTPSSDGQVVTHSYYSLSYDEQHEQAEWVYYKLTPAMISGSAKRADDFRPDNKIKTQSATLSDYAGSGYDRGHLCPAASMSINAKAMSESFYLSNMSPQHPSFNRGAWKNLEELVRQWAAQEKEVYVVTGPIFKNNKGQIGKSQVTVPGYYYKVVYVPADKKMIGFVMPNEKIGNNLASYVEDINEIEILTGINFFPQLNDSLENALEADSDVTEWEFAKSSYTAKAPANKVSSTNAVSVQCRGISKSTGKRCKNKTKSSTGYCHIHQPK